MFPSIKAGSGVRRLGLAIGLAGTLLVTASTAFAQSANDIIHDLAPIDRPSDDTQPPPGTTYPPPSNYGDHGRGADYRGHPYGPRVEDTDVYLNGRQSRAYIDYSRAIDLTVYFEYNSAHVSERARELLDRLGEALNSPKLRRYRFLIAGHTDAVGSDESNLDLSYRRAEAVREYLVQVHGIPRYRLAIKGWGRRRLKDPSDPESGINRRVEVALIVDQGNSYFDNPEGYPRTRYTNRFHSRRPWFTCPPGSRLIDPARPDVDIDDFAAGARNPMCRPID